MNITLYKSGDRYTAFLSNYKNGEIIIDDCMVACDATKSEIWEILGNYGFSNDDINTSFNQAK